MCTRENEVKNRVMELLSVFFVQWSEARLEDVVCIEIIFSN